MVFSLLIASFCLSNHIFHTRLNNSLYYVIHFTGHVFTQCLPYCFFLLFLNLKCLNFKHLKLAIPRPNARAQHRCEEPDLLRKVRVKKKQTNDVIGRELEYVEQLLQG